MNHRSYKIYLLLFLSTLFISCDNTATSNKTEQTEEASKAILLQGTDRMQIIGHRGAPTIAPENSMSSAKLAWKSGADMVECDVHLSKDGKVMVIHDYETDRVGDKNMEVASSSSDELRSVDLGVKKGNTYPNERIPYLSEFVEALPKDKKLVVELKTDEKVISPLKKVMKDVDPHQIVYISFNLPLLVMVKDSFPQSQNFLLIDSLPVAEVNALIDSAAKYQFTGVNAQHDMINEDFMDRAIKYGFPVVTWTVDSLNEAERLKDLGVAGLTTNRAAYMAKELFQIDTIH